jgi:hypothetical protein
VSMTVVMPAMMAAVIHACDIGDGAAVILSLLCLFKVGKGIEALRRGASRAGR